jgi:hypothetical protein
MYEQAMLHSISVCSCILEILEAYLIMGGILEIIHEGDLTKSSIVGSTVQ